MQSSKDINGLLQKYETKQPGEPNQVARFTNSEMKTWRMKQKIRHAQTTMDHMGLKGEQCNQVLYLIKEFPDTKKLCARCRYETVITALYFYVKFSNTKKRPLSDYAIARENGLTEEIYGRIVTKLAKHFQKQNSVRHVRYV